MKNANEAHAELGYRTLLVHAQYVSKNMSAGNIEEVVVDLLTSLMHLGQEYGANFDDMLRMAKDRFEADRTVYPNLKPAANDDLRCEDCEYDAKGCAGPEMCVRSA